MTSRQNLEDRLQEDRLYLQHALLVCLPPGLDTLVILLLPHENPHLQDSLNVDGLGVRLHQTGAIGILVTDGESVGQEAGIDTSRSLPVAEVILRAECRRHDQLDLFQEASLPTLIRIYRNDADWRRHLDSDKEGLLHHDREALHHPFVEDHKVLRVAFHLDLTHHRHVTIPQYQLEEAEAGKIPQVEESLGLGHHHLQETKIVTLWMGPLHFVEIMATQITCLVGGVIGRTIAIVAPTEVVR